MDAVLVVGEGVVYVDQGGWEYVATVRRVYDDATVDLEMPDGWGLGRVSVFDLRHLKQERKAG